jgi:hypothetical protein
MGDKVQELNAAFHRGLIEDYQHAAPGPYSCSVCGRFIVQAKRPGYGYSCDLCFYLDEVCPATWDVCAPTAADKAEAAELEALRAPYRARGD